jgi:hypothetical protein
VQAGDTAFIDSLNALDTETLLAAGSINYRNRRLAIEGGKSQLAAVHSVIGAYIDQALTTRIPVEP